MYSSISPPQFSPCFIPQPFSFGFNDDMNFTSMPMFHHYFTTPLISPTTSTTSHKLMLSPKSHKPRTKQSSSQKKDRNCKIVTAQGVRDRRVRLSTDIARRFFDLQDSLGFDTASKTIDWLLTKSRTAIKELQTKPVAVVEGNAKQLEACVNFNTGANEDSLKKNTALCTKRRLVRSSLVEHKEVRAKARARAKEISVEKRQVVSQILPAPLDSSEPLSQPIKSCKTCKSELFCFCLLNGTSQSEETFGNLGVITKKLKPSTVTSDNLEMNSCNTLFCSNNITNSSGDLQEIFGGINQ